ncbi:hypothetical protein [Flammeovirga sp. SJP92]|uniref:hypothetical protein n=1 Tax=Flammeovirga sp. SJP92 TaxID=1775430 RepID=UPI000789659C|nr:hypothetical protein [Flammeovirga sp. SJP92]KXX72223.1 hypothetical protein AVL50_01075 [Flammeovirga sp. SJP92]
MSDKKFFIVFVLCVVPIVTYLSFSPKRYTVGIVDSFVGANPSIKYKVNGYIYSVSSSTLRGSKHRIWLMEFSGNHPSFSSVICPLEKNMYAPPKGWTLAEVDSLQLLNARARRDLGL